MTDREKLIELLITAKDLVTLTRQADFLLANGVTITENHAGETVFALFDVSYCLLKNGKVKERATQIQSLRHLGSAMKFGKVEIREKKCTMTDSTFFGKTVFLTREEAEEAVKNCKWVK